MVPETGPFSEKLSLKKTKVTENSQNEEYCLFKKKKCFVGIYIAFFRTKSTFITESTFIIFQVFTVIVL
jgi:hypothetical protein